MIMKRSLFEQPDIPISSVSSCQSKGIPLLKNDFDLYSQIMSDDGIIMIHDTDKRYVENFIETEEHEDYDLSGPSKFIDRLKISHRQDDFEILNLFNYGIKKDFPSSTGITILRKK